MEFTTTVSEQDFIAAYRLRCTTFFRRAMSILLYVFAVVVLLLHANFFVYEHMNPGDPLAAIDANMVDIYILPAEFFCLSCFLLFKVYTPFRVRRLFRKDLSQRGEAVVNLSHNGVSEKSSIGSNVYFPWTACACWRESRNVFVLMVQSGVYLIFPKKCMTASQRDELRSILVANLPKK